MPLVSIIMPYLKKDFILKKQLSYNRQSHKELEIIIDDELSDHSNKVLKKFKKRSKN